MAVFTHMVFSVSSLNSVDKTFHIAYDPVSVARIELKANDKTSEKYIIPNYMNS